MSGSGSGSAGIGFIAAMVAVLSFGSNFVPVKKVQTGDGVFFQWVMCNAIFVTSFPVLFAQVVYYSKGKYIDDRIHFPLL